MIFLSSSSRVNLVAVAAAWLAVSEQTLPVDSVVHLPPISE